MDKKIEDRWRKIDGFEFTLGGESFRLSLGMYSNGRGALIVFDDHGVQECGLTVNLVNEETEPDQFWVKVDGREEEMAVRLKELGLIENLPEQAGSGRVYPYAELWELRGPE